MIPRPSRTRRFVVVSVALALVAAACGGDDDDASDTTEQTGEDTGGDTGEDTGEDTGGDTGGDTGEDTGDDTGEGGTTVPPPSDQTTGGSLTYGTYGEGSGFDPAIRGLSYCNLALYDSLMKFDANGVAQPYMAESMTSEDNVVWTLKLREGVMFHDDTPLDAEAVVYNIERHQNPETASNIASLTRQIQSVTAVDDLTVEFTLTGPLSVFPALFAQANGLGVILSPTALETLGADYNTGPVGAGPFEFVEWIPDDHLTLRRNDNYWQEGLPYLDELVCRPLPDTQTRFQAIVAGDIDFTYMITAAEIKQAEDNSDLVTLKAFANGGEGMILNNNRPPFDDPRMREAFVNMLNLDAISEIRFAGQRDLAGAMSLIAPDYPLYNPELESVYPAFGDLDRAKELIDSYKADGGDPNFTFRLPNTPDRRAFGDMAGQLFAAAGLNVTMDYLDISEFVTAVLSQGDFQVAINSYPAFIGTYPQMWNAFHTDGTSNFGDFSDPEIDALLELAVSTTDQAESEQAWKDLQVKVAEKLPFVTYGRPPSAIITQPNVAGVDKYPDNTIFFATLSNEG